MRTACARYLITSIALLNFAPISETAQACKIGITCEVQEPRASVPLPARVGDNEARGQPLNREQGQLDAFKDANATGLGSVLI